MKKKSHYTETLEGIYAELDQLSSRSMDQKKFIEVLEKIHWNLQQAWPSCAGNPHFCQATGIAKGALLGLGQDVK